MNLFSLIHKAAVQQDMEAAWELIVMFEPMIRRKSIHPISGKVDEDLKTEIQLALLKKILRFRMDFGSPQQDK